MSLLDLIFLETKYVLPSVTLNSNVTLPEQRAIVQSIPSNIPEEKECVASKQKNITIIDFN